MAVCSRSRRPTKIQSPSAFFDVSRVGDFLLARAIERVAESSLPWPLWSYFSLAASDVPAQDFGIVVAR
eukprot:4166725-Pyramimonas_sp.AAC.1